MLKHFLILEWRSFLRSASFKNHLIVKILVGLFALYLALCFIVLGAASYFVIKEDYTDPLPVVSKILLYYFAFDLITRFLLQKAPLINIKPLLVLPLPRPTIIHFALGKTILSFFNCLHFFAFVPFFAAMLFDNRPFLASFTWLVAVLAMVYVNNFLNILLNNKDRFFYTFLSVVLVLAAMQYYDFFDVSLYTAPVFLSFFTTKWAFVVPILLVVFLYMLNFKHFRQRFYLDTGLAITSKVAKTENYEWLSRYGFVGTFLKNDIRLITRNKRSKSTVLASVLFLFYGLLFFTDTVEVYNSPGWHIFAAIFVTGGFLFTFGQFVPSWDSAYYSLMMTQNISYKRYLEAKWWLIVAATIVSTILAIPYIYFGNEVFLVLLCGAVYNIGVNSHLVLLGGAFTKTPIDLDSAKQVFGDKKALNLKTMLMSLPKLGLPVLLYGLGDYFFNASTGLLLVMVFGLLGFTLRNKVFSWIVKAYQSEKYTTIQAYKNK